MVVTPGCGATRFTTVFNYLGEIQAFATNLTNLLSVLILGMAEMLRKC